jgi:hypothetical protein
MTEHGNSRIYFPSAALADFRAAYPNNHRKLSTELHQHPLLGIEPLAKLAESLPEQSVEYNKGALPIGIAATDVPANVSTPE